MKLSVNVKKQNFTLYGLSVYLCVLLSCLVPRYMHTFKITAGIPFSMYTIIVIIVWLAFSRKISFFNDIGSWFLYSLFVLIISNFWRVEQWGVWGQYIVWSFIAILFREIIILKPTKETFEIIVRAITHALFIQLMIGLYEVISHNYLFENGAGRLHGYVAISMFYNLNDYCTFVATLFPFAIYRSFKHTMIIPKVVNLLFVIAAIYLVFLSGSRGGYLSLIMLCGVTIYLYCKKSKTRTIVVMGTGLAVILLALYVPVVQNAIASIVEAAAFLEYQSRESNLARINLIKNGLYFLGMTYGLGVGAGNLFYYLQHYAVYYIGSLAMMHNWYMEILTTFGIPFFLLYLAFHINIIFRLLNSYNITSNFWNINNTILLTFMIFSVMSISSSSNIYSEWVWMYLSFLSVYVHFRCQ